MGKVYDLARMQKAQYPGSVAWRLKKHCEVVEKHLNPGEEPKYVFCGQKNNSWYDVTTTCVIVLTDRRILIGQKRVLWGYFLSTITPDLYNDMQIIEGLLFGKLIIDTVKEKVIITNLSKKALYDIETNISEFMMEAKKKYRNEDEEK